MFCRMLFLTFLCQSTIVLRNTGGWWFKTVLNVHDLGWKPVRTKEYGQWFSLRAAVSAIFLTMLPIMIWIIRSSESSSGIIPTSRYNYCEQFWVDTEDFPVTYQQRYDHFAALLKLCNKYGGYLDVSWCENQWGSALNPVAMLKTNANWEEACRTYSQNFILEEKYTQPGYIADVESEVYGAYISGYCGNYGIRWMIRVGRIIRGRRGFRSPDSRAVSPFHEFADILWTYGRRRYDCYRRTWTCMERLH